MSPASGTPLGEYKRKRDFRSTAEPEGGETVGRRHDLAFVIQKHAASQLHYDLRLELDGVMLSWAVPKGPSLDPSVKRLAMQVEDHPVEYNTFEGTIPAGEYGGGTVMLWDRGTYRPDDMEPGGNEARAVRRGVKAGKLSITFAGERLRGSFALVRTERGAKPKWLLIKHRDGDARDHGDITAEVLTSVETGRTMDEIAAAGSTDADPSDAATSTAVLGPMLPTPARTLPTSGDWTYEPWRGGTRMLAYVTPEGTQLIDDRSRDATGRHDAIAEALTAFAGRIGRPFVADGELAADRASGDAVLWLADLLIDGDAVLVDRPWRERREALESLLRRRRIDGVARQQSDERGETMLRRARREEWPGLIARRLDAGYQPGRHPDSLLRLST